MTITAQVLTVLVAALHVGFLVLEMFLWTRPIGRRVFRQTAEAARSSATLAANQGLYNGLLAAGLVIGLVAGGPSGALLVRVFLGCVVVAGLYGALTVSWRILLVQAAPAAAALAASWPTG
jgi:putative membrane protein